MITRYGNLTPWYHQTRPRCEAVTLRDELQCVFSASWTGRKTPKSRPVMLCKTHADIADFPCQPLERQRVVIRDDY